LLRVLKQAPSDLLANALFAQARQGVTRYSLRAGREEAQGAGVVIVVINNADNNNNSSSSRVGAGAGAATAAAARVLFVTLAYLPLVDYRVVSSALNYSKNDLLLRQCGDLPTI